MAEKMNLLELNELLVSFNKVNIKESLPPTLMEIAGFPRWENVCSNILAFYLEPQREHGLGDLVLSSLLEIEQLGMQYQASTTNVSREVTTKKGNRIDLVIETDSFVIGIENKVDAELYNDLEDYESQIKKIANHRMFKCLVLAPSKYNNLNNGFVSITYYELFANIKRKIVDYMAFANNKYALFLIDFITTLEKKNFMESNAEFYSFCEKNNESISTLVKAHTKLVTSIYKKFREEVNRIYDDNGFSPKFFNMRGSYTCEAYNITLQNCEIRFQYEYPIIDGWKFNIWKNNNTPLLLAQIYEMLKESSKDKGRNNLRYEIHKESENIIIEFGLFETNDAILFIDELVEKFKQLR